MPRIISLLSSATEIVCALGREADLVGRSHECDYPESIKSLPICTRPRFPIDGTSAEIDAHVKRLLAAGEPIYEVDADKLRELRPDVILTQSHCVVCAVSDDDVARALCLPSPPASENSFPRDDRSAGGEGPGVRGVASVQNDVAPASDTIRGEGMPPSPPTPLPPPIPASQASLAQQGGGRGELPRVVSLAPNSLADLWASIARVAEAIGVQDGGQQLIASLKARIEKIVARRSTDRPTVACLEWLDPLMAAGNWVPELVELAGGVNLFGKSGEHSPWMTWEELLSRNPEIIIAMPCGFDLERTRNEMRAFVDHPRFHELSAARFNTYIVDGNQYFNRPGPRLVESLEILDAIISGRWNQLPPGSERLFLPIGRFLDAFQTPRPLVMDGAMGTELIRRRANDDDRVRNAWKIRGEYVASGAQVLVTDSFLIGLANPNDTIDANAPVIFPNSIEGIGGVAMVTARFANPGRWVLGSVGPAASPPNFPDRERLLCCVKALDGVHAILLETCSDASALTATDWIRERFPDLPVLVSLTFAPNQDDNARDLAKLADKTNIAALGVNCGREQSPADVGRTLRIFREHTSKPLFARPNAGTPAKVGDEWIYPLGPDEWADETAKLCEIGLVMIGGCCGTTPEHIRALHARLRGNS